MPSQKTWVFFPRIAGFIEEIGNWFKNLLRCVTAIAAFQVITKRWGLPQGWLRVDGDWFEAASEEDQEKLKQLVQAVEERHPEFEMPDHLCRP